MVSRILKVVASGAAAGALFAAASAGAAGPPPPVAASGATVQQVASGLGTVTTFAFGANTVFEGDGGSNQSGPPNGGVFALGHGGGTKLAGSPNFVAGLAWRSGTLYVSGGSVVGNGQKWQLLAWSGWNGTSFTSRKVLYTAPKRITGFNGIGFGANGRLYVGVSLSQTGDHGPATTPYGYDILSFNSHGKDLKVVATGIRQPWQMAFPAGSSSPFVTALSQDLPAGIKAPDFLLRVKPGQAYGFPSCNWVKPTPCRGFAKPVRFFSPHTDPMGIGIANGRIYVVTGFAGATHHVISLPLSGHGAAKTILTGVAAPFVGLGIHGGFLYVGDAAGDVYRVKL
jgi:glucose/arabinose dehydrogenase